VILVGLGLWYVAGWPGEAHGLAAMLILARGGALSTGTIEEIMRIVMGLG